MRSRVQVSLPLPTKNQALASTQVLFFYPFSGFTTKFPPPSAAHCSGIGSSRSTDPLAKNSKKSAVRLSPAPLREPLEGAFEGSLFGPSAGVVGGASARRLCGSCWRSLCSAPSGELLGHPWRSFWGASAGTFAGATKNPSSKDGFHTQTLTIQTMQWLNFLLFVSDTKVGQNASWDNRHN